MRLRHSQVGAIAGGDRPSVLFRYMPQGTLSTNPGFGGTFTRADASTCATYVDANGVVQTVAANIIRDSHYIGGVRTTLLEGSRTNICLRSDALNNATWSKFGAPTVTDNFVQSGALNLSRIQGTPGTDGISQAITFTGDGVKSFLVFAKSNGTNGTHNWQLRDNTAPAVRGEVILTVTGTVVSGSASTGTLLQTQALGSGIYAFLIQTTSVTAANAHTLKCGPDAGTCTDIVTGAVQVENAAFPSSYIATGAAAVTRAADALSFPFSPVPQAMTVYGKGVFYGAVDSTTNYTVAMISNSGSGNPYLWLRNDASVNKAQTLHHNGSVLISNSATGTAFASGDTGELRGVLQADGSVITGSSVNGATESVSSASAANALAAAWASTTLYVGAQGNGTQCVFAGIQKLVIASGVQSLATMRGL